MFWQKKTLSPEQAEKFILSYQFDESIFKRASKEYPKLLQVRGAVEEGLRQWLITCAWRRKDEIVDMPSLSVDWVWHSFILHTAQYVSFCQQAYGGYLHHHPVTITGGIKVPLTPAHEVYQRSELYRKMPHTPALFMLDNLMGVNSQQSQQEQTASCFVDSLDPFLVGKL